MLYSPERDSLAGAAIPGVILPQLGTGEAVSPGIRLTLQQQLKEADKRRMGRGKKAVFSRFATRATQALPALAFVALVSGGATSHAQSAGKWYKRGLDAEIHQDWDTAYEDFRQANLKNPKDLRFKAHFESMRFQAAVAHVDRGRVLRQNGDLNGALSEFNRAIQIDSGNQAAHQELEQVQREMAAPPQAAAPSPGIPEVAGPDVVSRSIGSVAGPIELKPVSNAPVTLHAVEDVKNIYAAIGKMAGLNVIFDPDYTSKRIPVDLTNVTLADALRIVGVTAGTFYKPVTPNTIFVAQNNRTKRADLDELAVQTFYLTNAAQQQDANEVLTALRNLMDPSMKITLVPSQNAIVLRATPDQLLLAQKLIADLDRARPEVVVDVAILQVNRDKVRNLGITLPQSITITPQATPGSTSSSSSSGSSSDTTTTTPSNFTLNSLANLNAKNFAVGIPAGTLNALLTNSDTRILQNPRIRATDGQKANLKIGQKIPIATGSYSSTLSATASLGVQTQFTYLDVGVEIDMTPTVHFNHDIGLKVKMTVSSQQGSVTISGVTEPIIGQNVVEQQIQLKEGEPSILAGLVTKQDNRSTSGTPFLGEIPFFKYFFATNNKEVLENEIVFLLIPHIVRESVLTRANLRAVDTGTGQGIELRQDDSLTGLDTAINPLARQQRTQATTAANAATAAVQEITQQAKPLAPPPTPNTPGQTPPAQTLQGAPVAGGTPISLTVAPPAGNQAVGSTFTVAVGASNARDLYSVPLQLQFNPAVLQLVNVDAGDLLSRDGQAVSIVHRDEGNGLVTISTSRPPNVSGVNGQGSVATLTFKAVAAGDSNLSLVKVGARSSTQANIPVVGSQSVVHVR